MFTTTTHDTETDLMLTAAVRCTIHGPRNVNVYDDALGDLFVFGHEYGATLVVRALSFEDAYDIAIDEMPTVDAYDVPEAYGFDSQAELDEAVDAAAHFSGDYPELVEGFEYQSNATGTGIVNVGHYAWLNSLETFNAGCTDRIVPVFTVQ